MCPSTFSMLHCKCFLWGFRIQSKLAACQTPRDGGCGLLCSKCHRRGTRERALLHRTKRLSADIRKREKIGCFIHINQPDIYGTVVYTIIWTTFNENISLVLQKSMLSQGGGTWFPCNRNFFVKVKSCGKKSRGNETHCVQEPLIRARFTFRFDLPI